MTKKNEVANAQKNEIALAGLFEQHAGKNLEDISAQERTMPYLRILQDGSPERKKSEDRYIEGAEAGMLINSATDELISGESGVVIVPLFRRRCFVERTAGQKDRQTIARHEPESALVLETLQANRRDAQNYVLTASGNQLVETVYLSALLLDGPDAEDGELVCIVFQRTKLQAWKKLIGPIDRFSRQYPMFAHRIRLTTSLERRDAGNSYNFVPTPVNAKPGASLRENIEASLIQSENLFQLVVESAEFIERALESGERTLPDESTEQDADVDVKKTDTTNAPF